MTEISSPWREVVAILIGGGAYKLFDLLLAYQRQKADRRLVNAQAEGETVGSLERRVTATVKVIDIYQESNNDFAERIRSLRAENRVLKAREKLLEHQLEQERAERRLLEDKAPRRPGNGKGG